MVNPYRHAETFYAVAVGSTDEIPADRVVLFPSRITVAAGRSRQLLVIVRPLQPGENYAFRVCAAKIPSPQETIHARVCSKSLLAAFALALSAAASADGGFYLPPAPSGPGGEDVIETASGTRCRQSINGNGAYLDVGLAASRSAGDRDYPQSGYPHGDRTQQNNDALGYARVTVPLGKRPQRIDCARLYEMEIVRMHREIELLKLAAE